MLNAFWMWMHFSAQDLSALTSPYYCYCRRRNAFSDITSLEISYPVISLENEDEIFHLEFQSYHYPKKYDQCRYIFVRTRFVSELFQIKNNVYNKDVDVKVHVKKIFI